MYGSLLNLHQNKLADCMSNAHFLEHDIGVP